MIEEPAKLTILKAVFKRGLRKWQFVWNGVPISAPIKDPTFFDKLEAREYVFGQGDVLDAVLRIRQGKDEETGVFMNDPHSYEVVEVRRVIPAPRQQIFSQSEHEE